MAKSKAKEKVNGAANEQPQGARDDALADFTLALETLTGDVRDVLLTHVRSMEEPWSKLSEDKQQEKLWAIQSAANDLVRRIATLTASQGFDHVLVKVGKLTITEKGVVQSVFECTKSEENVVHLMDRQNGHAVLILVDPADYFGERHPARPEPDEPEIPLADAAA